MAHSGPYDNDSTVEYSDSDLSETAYVPIDLREENADLKACLDRATCKIMKLQGTTDHITDVEIEKGFESLQDAIQWWINGVEKDLRKQSRDFRHAFIQQLNHRDTHSVIKELGFGDETGHEADTMWMRWLSELSTCIYIVLGRQIWVYLYKKIFSQTYPTGVSEDSKSTFDDILLVMKSGGEDENTVRQANKWRSDTINSLVKTEAFQSRKGHMMKKLSRGLAKTLGLCVDPEALERHRNTIETNLIQRAIDLHEKIACSPYEYLITDPVFPDLVRGEMPDESKLSCWTVKDIVRLRPIYDNIAGVFQCLYPGIYRRGMPGEENVPAILPVVLVYDHSIHKTPRAPARRSQPQKSVQRSPCPSPERHDQGLPPTAPPNRASTFPSLEDPAAARQSQHMGNSSFMSILNVLGQSTSVKKRAKTPSSSSRNKTSEPNNHSSLDRKRSKSKSRNQPQSVYATPSSLVKLTPIYKAEDVSRLTSIEPTREEVSSTPLAPQGDHDGIIRARRNTHEGWEYGPDNEIFVNEYGAREIRYKHRSNPSGVQMRPETENNYGA